MTIPAYAALSDLRDESNNPPAWSYITPYNPTDDPMLEKLLLRASRVFDNLAQVTPGYFKAGDNQASARVVAGDGTNYLRLPVYVAGTLSRLVMPVGYQLPTYAEVMDERGQQWLIKTDASGLQAPSSPDMYWDGPLGGPLGLGRGWPLGLPVTITARWGYETTPEDVKEAVLELTAAIHRSKDVLTQQMLELDKSPQLLEATPKRVKEIARSYAKSRAIVLA